MAVVRALLYDKSASSASSSLATIRLYFLNWLLMFCSASLVSLVHLARFRRKRRCSLRLAPGGGTFGLASVVALVVAAVCITFRSCGKVISDSSLVASQCSILTE